MLKTVSEDMELNMSAEEAWGYYGTLGVVNLVGELKLVDKIEVEGNGDVGTTIKVTFPPGTPHLTYYKEVYTKIDNEKREKVAEMLEGGRLDAFGIAMKKAAIAIAEKGENSCVATATVEFEIKEGADFEGGMAALQPMVNLMVAATEHIKKNRK